MGLALLLVSAATLPAQRKGGGGGNNNLPGAGASDLIVHGSVVLPGGMVPGRLVAVARTCAGRSGAGVFADSKGRFSFDLGVVNRQGTTAAGNQNSSSTFSSASDMRNCTIRASLAGYRTDAIALEGFIKSEKGNLGELMLQPVGKQPSVVMSATDADVPKNARKEYDAGLDDAAKSKWPEAIAAMEKATAAYPKFATAWLGIGMLEASRGNSAAALHAYTQAIEADGKFAPAYVELAALQSVGNEWSKAVESSGKAIALDADAFPRAYYLNAVAHVRLNEAESAEKSAVEGIRVDTDHELPDLEYIEGVLLISKGDVRGARMQLQNYLAHAPNGINAANARQQLAELPEQK
jgi:tetratricopeptide (TPR) repeat protein